MSLLSFVIKLGAAICSVTGGTDKTFTPNGKKLSGNGIMIVNSAEVDPTKREVITAYASTPVYNAKTASWSDEMREITFSKPIVQPDGSFKFRTIRLKLNFEAGIAAADLSELRAIAAQLAFDSDGNDFYVAGSMS